MRLFADEAVMRELMGGHKKWLRTLEALDAAPGLPQGVTHSIGDSLTYRRDVTAALATEHLVGRRRYQFVLAALTGDLVVEVSPKTSLEVIEPYDDTTDRELLRGPGSLVTVRRGEVLVLDIDEAARVHPRPEAEAVQLHVTVEGASFHNK